MRGQALLTLQVRHEMGGQVFLARVEFFRSVTADGRDKYHFRFVGDEGIFFRSQKYRDSIFDCAFDYVKMAKKNGVQI